MEKEHKLEEIKVEFCGLFPVMSPMKSVQREGCVPGTENRQLCL